MNKLLPQKLCDLEPISGKRNVFGETAFVKPYNMLKFSEKLKIACDLVRQTMLVCSVPNPMDDVESLTGDSYTACVALVNYLIENNLGCNYKVCFARKSIYEADCAVTTHFIVLVSDEFGNCFQIDPSPCVGYKCGKVESINHKWYSEYTVVEGELKLFLETFRRYAYELENSRKKSLDFIMPKILYAKKAVKKYEILKGYLFLLCKICKYEEDVEEVTEIRQANFEVAQQQLFYDLQKLQKMRNDNDDIIYQLELIQTISSERKKFELESENFAHINGKDYKVSELTPRFFYEQKLNLAMLKTSSFFINCDENFKKILADGHMITGGYSINLGESKTCGFSKMIIFHPDGCRYINEMNGPNYMFLIQDNVENILTRKKEIRKKYSPNFEGKTFKWYNGQNIRWRSIAMNLVHSADNSAETCCHYQCGYPNSQLMTRFMYPNLKLIY